MNIFALLLLAASVISGIAWAYDFFKNRPGRRAALEALIRARPEASRRERKAVMEPRGLVGQTGSLFFIILFVFVVRSFVVEPFRIPSGSMLPTLYVGDFIAVTKWNYGIREPVTNRTLIPTGVPARGDVVVFKSPEDPGVDYIKRVIGLPGDIIVYANKNLLLLSADQAGGGGLPQVVERVKRGEFAEEAALGMEEIYDLYEERLGEVAHAILINPGVGDLSQYFYRQPGLPVGAWKVPENCYFAMGDNRDNSRDSRFWGFVPQEYIVGKTVGIWLSLEFKRSEKDLLPSFIPTAVRLERLGGLK